MKILNRFNDSVIFEADCETVKDLVLAAVKQRADLRGAYLEGAYLEGAYLVGANLEGADLRGAYLEGADLVGANLEGADLRGAYLEGADLEGAYLEGAYLEGAYLVGANLEGADLRGAYLEGANLRDVKGILKEGVKPLQISGSQHFLIVQEIGKIRIGCEHHTVEHWLENFKEIGSKAGYTDAQIEEYFEHIKYAEQWMIKNGVRFLEEYMKNKS